MCQAIPAGFVSERTIFVASALRIELADLNRRMDCGSQTIAVDIDDVYELPPVDGAGSIPDEWQSSATYNLEMAVRCPHCDEAIRTIRIVGLSRSQVAFTSTLPRKGRIAICPECDRILPVELSGML